MGNIIFCWFIIFLSYFPPARVIFRKLFSVKHNIQSQRPYVPLHARVIGIFVGCLIAQVVTTRYPSHKYHEGDRMV